MYSKDVFSKKFPLVLLDAKKQSAFCSQKYSACKKESKIVFKCPMPQNDDHDGAIYGDRDDDGGLDGCGDYNCGSDGVDDGDDCGGAIDGGDFDGDQLHRGSQRNYYKCCEKKFDTQKSQANKEGKHVG